jgi:1,6-anhydro-N-acetylmuramate kinase
MRPRRLSAAGDHPTRRSPLQPPQRGRALAAGIQGSAWTAVQHPEVQKEAAKCLRLLVLAGEVREEEINGAGQHSGEVEHELVVPVAPAANWREGEHLRIEGKLGK